MKLTYKNNKKILKLIRFEDCPKSSMYMIEFLTGNIITKDEYKFRDFIVTNYSIIATIGYSNWENFKIIEEI